MTDQKIKHQAIKHGDDSKVVNGEIVIERVIFKAT